MARADKILKTFLSDSIIKDKYNVDSEDYPTLTHALNSDVPIVKAIAIIIQDVSSEIEMNDKQLYQKVISFLNRTTA
jgi:hypothetical protein